MWKIIISYLNDNNYLFIFRAVCKYFMKNIGFLFPNIPIKLRKVNVDINTIHLDNTSRFFFKTVEKEFDTYYIKLFLRTKSKMPIQILENKLSYYINFALPTILSYSVSNIMVDDSETTYMFEYCPMIYIMIMFFTLCKRIWRDTYRQKLFELQDMESEKLRRISIIELGKNKQLQNLEQKRCPENQRENVKNNIIRLYDSEKKKLNVFLIHG